MLCVATYLLFAVAWIFLGDLLGSGSPTPFSLLPILPLVPVIWLFAKITNLVERWRRP